MRKIDRLLSEYGESHQNATNKTIHWICVPLIFFSMVGLVASIPSSTLQNVLGSYGNWATIVLIFILLYYVSLSLSLTIGMGLFAFACLFVAKALAGLAPLWLVCVIIFVLAWVGQFYGHKVEGKKPSFLKDLQFLLIGPAWLMHFIYKRWGIPY